YNKTFFVRGGYAYTGDINKDDNTFGFTAGAGINYQTQGFDIKVDYAYRDAKWFSGNHIFSVSLGF
ncbi:MAG: hypothetical protein Q8940_19800, partial [Bacteroidota bacterium]|nr:hypothetical protein [Bacteroidota bacterium]